MTEQHSDSLFEEVKVPIFCEFIFQKNLAISNVENVGTTFFKYINDSLTESSREFFTQTPGYSLPGFPGIKYLLSVYAYWEERMNFEFQIDIDYGNYKFDGDFTYIINNNEPKHFHENFDNNTDEDSLFGFSLLKCSNECTGCSACKDKIFVVQVEGTITVKYVDNISISYIYPREVEELYEENDTKDFVFVVEGKEIWVHKSLLSKNSTEFARMFDSDKWKETTENKIVIPEFSFKVVEFAIKAFYGMTWCNCLEKENYLMLFQFIDKYDMEKLKNAVKKCILLTPSTVVEYANFLLQNYFDELVDYCIDYILVCSQNSLPIKDIEMLDAQIRSMFFNRALISPVLKKDLKLEHRTVFKTK